MEEKPNTSVIEMYSINKLKDAVLRTGVIDPDIRENDKTPSWDGEMRLYHSSEFNKSNLAGLIPVQVKGTWVERFPKSKATFRAEVSDLRNYLNDGGVIFFLIQIKSYDDYKIYYTSLLPFDLRRILDSAGSQKTKQIKLDLFPHRYKDGIIRVCYDFLTNKRKQASLLPDVRSVQDLEKSSLEIDKLQFSVPSIGLKNRDDLFEELLSHPQYIYVKPKNIDLAFAVDKIYPQKIVAKQKNKIIVNGEVLYDHIAIIREPNNKQHFKLGNDITIIADDHRFLVNYQFKGTLQEQIREMKLMSAMMQKQPIYIGKVLMPAFSSLDFHGHTLDEISNRLSDLLRADATLKKLHVQKDLSLGSLTDKEISNLNYLIDGILDGSVVPLRCSEQLAVGKISIGNITLLLVMKKADDNAGCFIRNFFEIDDLVLAGKDASPEHGTKVSPYVLMTAEQLETIDNVDLSEIVSSIRQQPYSAIYGEHVVLLTLELLKLYDRRKDTTILDVVIQLLGFLSENDSAQADLYQINRLQTEKRRRKLNSEEIQYLSSMKNKGIPAQYQLAANILLESFYEAQLIYEQLCPEEKETFASYPIMNLWKSKD